MSEISKLEQNLIIKKIDEETVNIQIIDNEILMSIVGQFDQNLKEVDQTLAKERLIIFQNISKKIKSEYRARFLTKIVPVLFENKTKEENKYFGRDEHFNSVIVESNENLTGKIKNIQITKLNQNTLFGKISPKLIQKDYAA